jgi:hypothetical protein
MSKTRVILAGLSAIAVLGAVTSSAAAQPQVKACVNVGPGNGGFSNAACNVEALGGEWAMASIVGNKWFLCLANPAGPWKNALCGEAAPPSRYEHTNTGLVAGMGGVNNGNAVLTGKVAGDKVKITCTTNTLKATGEEDGKTSEGKIEYSGCTVTETNKCKVAEPIVAEFTGQTETGPAIKFTGDKSGGTFAEVTFENKPGETCALKGTTTKATGSQTCSFDASIATFAVNHEVLCSTSGSNLKLGGNTATYEGNDKEVKFPEGEYPWNVS